MTMLLQFITYFQFPSALGKCNDQLTVGQLFAVVSNQVGEGLLTPKLGVAGEM